MAGTLSRPWTRLQDWVTLLAGAFMALSPLWVDIGTGGTWAMVIIGAAIGVLALVALALPGAFIDEWATAAGGVVAFVAPWLFSYSALSGAAWTSWIVGAVVVVSALAAVPASLKDYRMQHHTA
ncbi:SPW repeat domain-containing protein [Amycolatopsis alkalitolerans]|nr:SPW repeat protein [Amycolatopsis alkalitolerans]